MSSHTFKKIYRVYRDAVDIFGRKLSENEKKILLKEMKKNTSFNLESYKKTTVAAAIIGCSIGAASVALFNSIGFKLDKISTIVGITVPVATSFIFAVYPIFLSKGMYVKENKEIVLSKNPKESEIFHESLHFLQGKGIIKNSKNPELIPTAATALYSCMSIKHIDEVLHSAKLKILSIIYGSKYLEGYKLAKEILRIRDEYGERAAWDHLYDLSQKE